MSVKNLKTRLLVILTACTLALCGGFSFIPPATAYAEEVTENVEVLESAENGEILSEIEQSEQEPVESEIVENSGEESAEIVDEESADTVTKEEVAGLVKEAYEKAKTWIVNTYAWIIGIGGGSVLACLSTILSKLICKKIARTNNLTEAKVEEIVERTTKAVVASIVGKSLNVDIQAEVSECVKNELAPMIRNAQVAMESAKNAEVGTALVMRAQAKSRLISAKETAELENRAASLLSHAEKFGGLSVPIQIKAELPETKETVKEKVNLVETPNKPKAKKENESYISF